MKISNIYSLPLLLFVALALAPAHAAQLNTKKSTLTDTTPTQDVPPAPAPSPEAKPAPAETKFDTAIDDLPLMPGLEAISNEDTLFVVPHTGRIAESSAAGAVDIDDVYKFYHKSLPQLGWKTVDMRTYMRDNELLRISAHANGKITTVRFSIKPNN